MKGKRGKEVGRKKEGEAGVRQRMSACAEVQQQQERGEEWSRLARREEAREKKPHELLEWCASSSPLAYPKIPGAGNVKARRTTDAIPQRGSAGIISEGNGGLKWRTNFSKTSSERNVHALRLFFHPPLPSPPPYTRPSLSLYFLCVVFRRRHHSSAKLIFLKIKARTTLN